MLTGKTKNDKERKKYARCGLLINYRRYCSQFLDLLECNNLVLSTGFLLHQLMKIRIYPS